MVIWDGLTMSDLRLPRRTGSNRTRMSRPGSRASLNRTSTESPRVTVCLRCASSKTMVLIGVAAFASEQSPRSVGGVGAIHLGLGASGPTKNTHPAPACKLNGCQ